MKIKNLLVSGCSFTYGESWASIFAKKHNLKLINLAAPGAGNLHIANSIILYLERNTLNIEDTLIGVMWSNPMRTDFMVTPTKKYCDLYRFTYDDHNRLIVSGDVLHKHNLTKEAVTSEDKFSAI
jgi:hypothetical protein